MPFYDAWSLTQVFIADLFRSLAVPDHLAAFVVVSAFAMLLGIELQFTRSKRRTPTLRQSYRTNLATFLFNDLLMSAVSVVSLLVLAERYGKQGPLHQLGDPTAKAAIAFVLFDLTLYLWHRANHTFDWLWTFHRVHHSDRSMNVSTAFRLSFIELLFTTGVKAVFIVATGVEAVVVAACEAVTTVFVLFHHTNITFGSEKWLRQLIIVPSLHRVHHSVLRKEHDSNYGAVFSFWDRVFGTFSEPRPVTVGLPNVGGQNFLELLRFGFPHATPPQSTPMPASARSMPAPETLNSMIAEAAYYRAQMHGFRPGSDVSDWLVAEREIMQRFG
jgi:sterol desaturase/sphingolipid hydroxylase (fatty acid hydroxylase superfamily)